MFARLLHPLVVRLPFFFCGIAGQRRRSGFVPGKAVGEGRRLGFAIADAGAADIGVETHVASAAILGPLDRIWVRSSQRRRPHTCFAINACHWDTPESCWLRRFSNAPWLWRNPSW